jgi:malate:Na+ symporter
MIGGFAVIMISGMALSEIGFHTPILKDIGGPAILSLMVPSFLVFYNWLNPPALNAVTMLVTTSNFLYLSSQVSLWGACSGWIGKC